jgi:hypothetical protein
LTPDGLDAVDGFAVGPLMKMPVRAIGNAHIPMGYAQVAIMVSRIS